MKLTFAIAVSLFAGLLIGAVLAAQPSGTGSYFRKRVEQFCKDGRGSRRGSPRGDTLARATPAPILAALTS